MGRRYVLMTAARNEQDHIGKTLDSVVSQTEPPLRWVVVSDGSTDDTDRLVRERAAGHPFIRLIRREPGEGRNFGSKVQALELALDELRDLEYDFIGNLDADVSFGPDYFERVLDAFDADPRLGVAGGVIHDRIRGGWVRQVSDHRWSVAGAVQMFRRRCFEEIGGYRPLRRGGVDAVAEIRARMLGYGVRGIEELPVRHHQLMGTKSGDILGARFRQGRMEYAHGYDPLFEAGRCLLRFRERPFVIGSLFRMSGYLVDALRGAPRDVPGDMVAFLRREQRRRMAALFGIGNSGEPDR